MNIGNTIVVYPDDRSATVGTITAMRDRQVYVEVYGKYGMFSNLTKWEGWLTLQERDGLPPCAVPVGR